MSSITGKTDHIGGGATRELIVEAADRLFYRQGFEHTSFADIAAALGISRGNFYYHFKSKDEILSAVISFRLDDTRRELARWESECTEPADRIMRFIDILAVNQAQIKHHGCPVGTLCSELAKLRHNLRQEADAWFSLFRTWLGEQFTLLGHKADADMLAMRLIARSQGIAALASVFHDEKFIKLEVRQLHDWVKSLGS